MKDESKDRERLLRVLGGPRPPACRRRLAVVETVGELRGVLGGVMRLDPMPCKKLNGISQR